MTPEGHAPSDAETAPIVCPECRYGFVPEEVASSSLRCPRTECGHRWETVTQTMMAVHASTFRFADAELTVVAGDAPLRVDIPQGISYIGRDPSALLRLSNLNVSRRHAKIVRKGSTVSVEDSGSASGTSVNDSPLDGAVDLKPRDVLLIGGASIRFDLRYRATDAGKQLLDGRQNAAEPLSAGGQVAERVPLTQNRITFGRAPDRTVVLPDPLISAKHAVVESIGGTLYVSDLQSRIGTFVNGKSVIRARLEIGDRVQLGPYAFLVEDRALVRVRRQEALSLSAAGLTQRIGSEVLLNDLTFSVQPGEFVGLLGPSGAGKSTLLNACSGLRPAVAGTVSLGGDSLYSEYARLRHLIGFVPQEDILHRELTCRQALSFAARLRLPPDVRKDELRRIVDGVLETLGLTARADVLIGHLSGGQRKRVSVGAELLTKPGVLFLDEPTSGLDPSTESRLMRVFQRLAQQGRSVICTTHVMENVDLFDKLVVLARGGKMAYFGPPREAMAYFGISRFSDLYDALELSSPEEWKVRWENLQPRSPAPSPRAFQAPMVPAKRRAPRTSFVSQLTVLCARNYRVLGSDLRGVGLLAFQPLFIAGLICLVCSDLPMILFLLTIAALWFGCSNAAQAIVGERPVLRRERSVNLRLDAYVLARFAVLAAVSFVQAALMLGLTWSLRGFEGMLWPQAAALCLVALVGAAMGLIISSLADRAEKAMFVVPLSLLPQFIFAGVLVALPEMNAVTRGLSFAAASRWANQTMEAAVLEGKTIDAELLEEESLRRPLWNQYPDYDFREPEDVAKFLTDHDGEKVDLTRSIATGLAVLAGFVVAQVLAVGASLRLQELRR